jgi:hypothetical protein
MLPQLTHPIGPNQRHRRTRDQHLATMPGCSDPGRQMDVDPEVALFGQMRWAGVHADAHLDRTIGEGGRGFACCLDGTLGRGEGDEEAVALGADLDSAVRQERVAHDAPMVIDHAHVLLRPQLVEELGRALDVAEEEGHRAGGQVTLHGRPPQ